MTIRELLTKISLGVNLGVFTNVLGKINGIRGGLLGIVAGAASAAAGIAGFALKSAGEFEQSSIAFETMLGSAEKAQILLADITTFAKETPFELTGLIQSSKKLLAFGIGAEDIISTMTNLGNIAAGVGTDKLPSITLAFGKIRTKGRASMEELNILLEAGVPILDELASGFDISTQELFKMVTAGKVGFKDVDKALERLATGNGKFANLMEKQSKSLFGIISNIKDTIGILARDIGQKLLPTAKELAKGFLEFVEANKDLIKTNIQKFLGAVAKVAKFLFTVFKSVTSAVFNLIGGISAFVDAIGGARVVALALAVILFQISGNKMRRGWRLLRVVVKRGLIPALKNAGRAAKALNIKLILIPILVALALDQLIKAFRGERNIFTIIGKALDLLGIKFDIFIIDILLSIKNFSPFLNKFFITPLLKTIELLDIIADKLGLLDKSKIVKLPGAAGERLSEQATRGFRRTVPTFLRNAGQQTPQTINVELNVNGVNDPAKVAGMAKDIIERNLFKSVKPRSDTINTPIPVTP